MIETGAANALNMDANGSLEESGVSKRRVR